MFYSGLHHYITIHHSPFTPISLAKIQKKMHTTKKVCIFNYFKQFYSIT